MAAEHQLISTQTHAQVRANAALDQGDVHEVCEAYKQLAKYFAQLGRLRTAEFFFRKCL